MLRCSPSSSRRGRRLAVVGLLALLAGLLPGRPLAAQALPPPPPGASPADSGAVLVFNNWYLPRYRPTATNGADTTGALLSLFRKRRYADWVFAAPFIVGMSLALPRSTTDQYGCRQVASEAISPPLGLTLLAGTLVGLIVHTNRYTKSQLVAVDRAYAAGQPIPACYRRRLTATHFAEAALLRTAIAQQQARAQAPQ